jgi:hypothetical protein
MKQVHILPTFFILGAAKAGTTTLFDLLSQHPQIFLSFDKEPMFFSRDDYYGNGLDWYSKTYFKGGEEHPVRGEASPHYLYWSEKVSFRIHEAYGDNSVKFIVMLRNPIQRAYSWYWNMVSDGREELSFLDALKNEDQRIKDNWEQLKYFGSMRYGYFRGGCYAEQLQYFLQDFSKEQFHFILQEDLIQDQKGVLKKVFQFLDVETEIDLIPLKSNQAGLPRNRSIQSLIRNPSRGKEILKSFIPYMHRHKLKTLFLKLNNKRFQYPDMSSESRDFLKQRYEGSISALSETLMLELSNWRQ